MYPSDSEGVTRAEKRVSGGPEAVRIKLLGGFRVLVGSRRIEESEWRLKKAGSLIKLLALASEHRLHREQVMNLLWPNLESEAAANNLHRTLHFARRVLEPSLSTASHYLHLQGEQLALCPSEPPLWVDVEAFEDAGATAKRSREPGAYRAAIELYSGELLPEDRYEGWAQERREELRALYLALLVEMAGLYEERGDLVPAIKALDRAVAAEPTHEEAHVYLMRLHATAGQRHKAILRYEQLKKALFEELDEEPSIAGRHLYTEIVAERFPSAHPPPVDSTPAEPLGDARRHNLPTQRTNFIGREQEMLEVKRLLSMTRLLTLTGSGGCGKTRLALEVAKDLVGAYPDGVWLVELAALSDPELVPNAVAAALGVHEQPGRPLEDALVDFLRSRRMLLVLDNCEHLIRACARLVDALLSSCEHLQVLATSREALGVEGEVNWLVPSLTMPNTDHLPATQSLTQYEAVQLFLERARSRLPAFDLTPENARSVAEVCRKLDGIPLAIELATARMTALAVDQIAKRLEDSLGLLTTGSRTAAPRQRTLRATLEWSYGLLSEPERALFRRLSVFAGGWTLEVAEEVGANQSIAEGHGRVSNPPVLDLLGRLVDKSLVVVGAGGDGGLRYRMLEPIRQYAWEKLEESGETELLRKRHAHYYLGLAEKAEPKLVGAGQVAWLERLTTEHANLRAALHWFLDEEGAKPEERAQKGLRLAAALGRFWSVHNPSEGRAWLGKGLARSDAPPETSRATALREAGLIAIYHLDPQAIAMLEEALALFKKLEDELGKAVSINYLMHGIGILGYHERMPTLREEIEALLEGHPEDRRTAAYLQLTLGMMAMIEEDHEQVTRIEEALVLFREVGDLRTCAMCLTIIGIAALGRGDAERAERAFEETLGLLWQLKDRIGTFYSLMGTAGVAVLQDQPARAARLSGAAEALRKALGHPAQPLRRIHYDYESFIATMRAELGEAAFEATFSEGESMSPEQAIEYALSADEPAPPATSMPEELPPPTLSRREREVALLIARGLTNRRIAKELSISERTVTTHVYHILKKLGATSRAQVAAWIVEQQLLPEEGPG